MGKKLGANASFATSLSQKTWTSGQASERVNAWNCIVYGLKKNVQTRLFCLFLLKLVSINSIVKTFNLLLNKSCWQKSVWFMALWDMCVPLYSILLNWLRHTLPKPPGVMQGKCLFNALKEDKATATGVTEWTKSHWAAIELDRDGQR